ncbi:uncharacterized protein M437DRAFT_66612 [Aureobasidium melanogenum CBS 110374]|uniref:Uncharacterized protein n=1 Tax=Aureobasidium melanogenum (strain CBS 110374) TaxID=1043003 RepID=A0A074VWU7_AURM1|nr:uncharacterized protein M437DRAFT_66612 [Aureobasidium melanogenum CBS 110374]KEQ62177.1 hypothetical protein M437DRAFT_66612 [Aureobasidium melanogenum CBS 110374]
MWDSRKALVGGITVREQGTRESRGCSGRPEDKQSGHCDLRSSQGCDQSNRGLAPDEKLSKTVLLGKTASRTDATTSTQPVDLQTGKSGLGPLMTKSARPCTRRGSNSGDQGWIKF